jgi:protein-S-isoprenylcysteine O-methyltransferase Ste14
MIGSSLLFAAIIDLFVIRREEAYLAERFGDAYASYRSRVRRWL